MNSENAMVQEDRARHGAPRPPVTIRVAARLRQGFAVEASLRRACGIIAPRLCEAFGLILVCSLMVVPLRAADLEPIRLPAPQLEGGKPLMQALALRRTIREFKPDKLPPQVLANLLWAAFGINRPGTGHRTAPSAMNSQEIDIYVALPEGLFLYEPKANQLKPVLDRDLRALTGGEFSRQAPVSLIFVAELPRLAKAKPESRRFYADFDAGCISQNVYLFCASEGLGTVVHDLDRGPLAAAMQLKPEQQIIFAQAVGYPKDPGLAR